MPTNFHIDNFKPTRIQYAKKTLSGDLHRAKQHFLKHKEQQKELLKEDTLWQKTITFFNKFF